MRKVIFPFTICLITAISSFAQQWSGSSTTTGTITRQGLVTLQSEGSGFIVDDATQLRTGFMKYFGKAPGIWRNPNEQFEIGHVSGTILSPTGYTTDMFFAGNGNIGIGTTSPGTFKLAVEGKIGAREVRVTSANPWPDFVFSRQYKLKSLASLEEFINKNHRLPEMPSAQEVKDNGIELGNMNAKLLEKIEELTLYVIDLKKEIEQLKNKRR